MRKIIWSVNRKKNIFHLVIDGKRTGFHLPNRLAKTFMPYLHKGVLVEFAVTGHVRTVGGEKVHQVAHFILVKSLSPDITHYDLEAMREEMRQVLSSHTNYVFIDFEMTMPGYAKGTFRPEIIQVGYAVSGPGGTLIESGAFHVLPTRDKTLSKRTRRFLGIEEETFFRDAVPYRAFYALMTRLKKTYGPKFVVWGKNDISALDDSYAINGVAPLTIETDFIDLLKLHKDYFNLKDDLGLFKAYKGYYGTAFEQRHDASDDAKVTKAVFDAFVKVMDDTEQTTL